MRADFEIHEDYDGDCVRLRLVGELDLSSAPVVRHRLTQLRAEKRSVRLDLSGVEFMDSSGVHLLIGALNDARADRWHLEVDARLSPQVDRLFELTNLHALIRRPSDGRAMVVAAKQPEPGIHADCL